ncbi:hypothetical protein BDW62DRAFT_215985 [Aspergillus aurantiobrunneus]
MSQKVIVSKDIYHGLPTFPDDLTGLTAIVAGANGISGHYMLRIYALSRRPPNGEWPGHVEHLSIDFLKAPDEIATVFRQRNIRADYAFFFSYIQSPPKEGAGLWSAAEDLVRDNVQLLHNFLNGLALARSIPKTILLQLGAKYYGGHLGPVSIPAEESDPRVHLEPNFYYNQEDLLTEFADHHGISWVTTRPSWIPGAVPDAAMNLCFPLAVYATVQKHLGDQLEYPSDLTAWEASQTMSSAQMNAYTSEWAVLSGNVNQSFNAQDDCVFTWGKFWPKLARHFGIQWKGPDTGDTAAFKQVTTPYAPPPRGFGPPATIRYKFTLTEWAKRTDVQEAWKEIAATYKLREPALRDIDRVFGFADAAIFTKKLGFFGCVDSAESMFKVFGEFMELRMIPPFGS